MANESASNRVRLALLSELAEELKNLDGAALEQFLIEIGEDPNELLERHDAALQGARLAHSKKRFEDAKAQVRAKKEINVARITSLDLSKKRSLLDAISMRGEKTGELTLAARNRKIESESDIDSLLEAYLRLGLIDEQGHMKD